MDIHTTSPLKLFEYMASKSAIVATGIPTVAKVLEHRRNALLAQPGDVDAFTSLVEEALDDPVFSQRLGDEAYLDVQKCTSVNKCRKILSSLIGTNIDSTSAL